MADFRDDFLAFAVAQKALRFGSFQTKAGRQSPYFFNAGLFNDGQSLRRLAGFYRQALTAAALDFDMVFGPAYKGIPLATALAMAWDQPEKAVPFAFNRKEAKDHGEGGTLVGAPLQGRVLIVDDVISAGTSVRESVALIREQGAQVAGVVIALDRQERGQSDGSAVAEVQAAYGVPVVAVARLADLLVFLERQPEWGAHLPAVQAYRHRYGSD